MVLAFRALGLAVTRSYGRVFWSLVSSLLTAVLSAPLILAVVVAAVLLGVPQLAPPAVALFAQVLPNPALAGAQTFAWNSAHEEDTSPREYWHGLRRWWRPAGRAWLLAAPVTILLLGNLAFYVQQGKHSTLWQGIAVLWLMVLFLWIAVHLFVYPLLMAQEEDGLLTTYRNAAVLVLARPLFVAVVVPFWCLFLLVTNFSGFVLVAGLAISAMLQQSAAVLLLRQLQRQEKVGSDN